MSLTILKNATAAQLFPAKVWQQVDIAIKDDLILAVDSGLEQRYMGAKVIEMQGRLVMPGLVCAITTSTPVCRAGFRRKSPPAPILSRR